MVALDEIDRTILSELQQDASRSTQEIADLVGLSQNACWRRIRRLETDGIIRARVALVDPVALGKPLIVFVSVRTTQHSPEWLDRFAAAVREIPEVIELHRMTGDIDYLLKIVAADVAEYDRIYKRLIRAVELHDVSSSFVMEPIKSTTAIPLPPAR